MTLLECLSDALGIIAMALVVTFLIALFLGGWFYLLFNGGGWKVVVIAFFLTVIGLTLGLWLHDKYNTSPKMERRVINVRLVN